MSDDDKSLIEKAGDAVSDTAKSMKRGLKRAGKAVAETASSVAEAAAPKPVDTGDALILPSTDPAMPPVVIRKRARRKKIAATRRTSKVRRAARPGQTKMKRVGKARKTTARKRKSAPRAIGGGQKKRR